jgi:hypothetical protein
MAWIILGVEGTLLRRGQAVAEATAKVAALRGAGVVFWHSPLGPETDRLVGCPLLLPCMPALPWLRDPGPSMGPNCSSVGLERTLQRAHYGGPVRWLNAGFSEQARALATLRPQIALLDTAYRGLDWPMTALAIGQRPAVVPVAPPAAASEGRWAPGLAAAPIVRITARDDAAITLSCGHRLALSVVGPIIVGLARRCGQCALAATQAHAPPGRPA